MSEEQVSERELLLKISDEIDRRASVRGRILKILGIAVALAITCLVALVITGEMGGPINYSNDKQKAFEVCMSESANSLAGNFSGENVRKECELQASCTEKDEFLNDHPEWKQYTAPGCN